jgi:hypothetical protein
MTPEHFSKEVEFVQETQRLIERSSDQPFAQRRSLLKDRELQPRAANLPMAVLLSGPIEPFYKAVTRANARLNGYRCLVAVKLWQLENGSYPKDLEAAVKAAGMNEIPADPYSDGGKIHLADINSRPVIYSVGSDLKDDGGRRDWKYGQQPGDFLFPLPER